MGVPRPPMSVPRSSALQSSVKPDRRTAAGTLLMTWLASAEVMSGREARSSCKKLLTAGMAPIFPAKTKKQTKVASRP